MYFLHSFKIKVIYFSQGLSRSGFFGARSRSSLASKIQSALLKSLLWNERSALTASAPEKRSALQLRSFHDSIKMPIFIKSRRIVALWEKMPKLFLIFNWDKCQQIKNGFGKHKICQFWTNFSIFKPNGAHKKSANRSQLSGARSYFSLLSWKRSALLSRSGKKDRAPGARSLRSSLTQALGVISRKLKMALVSYPSMVWAAMTLYFRGVKN